MQCSLRSRGMRGTACTRRPHRQPSCRYSLSLSPLSFPASLALSLSLTLYLLSLHAPCPPLVPSLCLCPLPAGSAQPAGRRVTAPRWHARAVREQLGGDAGAERCGAPSWLASCLRCDVPSARDARRPQQCTARALLPSHLESEMGKAGKSRWLLQVRGVGEPGGPAF